MSVRLSQVKSAPVTNCHASPMRETTIRTVITTDSDAATSSA